jgi:hypothetical protein
MQCSRYTSSLEQNKVFAISSIGPCSPPRQLHHELALPEKIKVISN